MKFSSFFKKIDIFNAKNLKIWYNANETKRQEARYVRKYRSFMS